MSIGPNLNPAPIETTSVEGTPAAPPVEPDGPSSRDAVVGIGAAVLIAGAALTLLARARFEFGPPLRLPRVGEVSEVTLSLSAVALLVLAYHVVVYSLGIEGFRAPMWAVLAGGACVIVGSLLLDAFEGSAP